MCKYKNVNEGNYDKEQTIWENNEKIVTPGENIPNEYK